MLTVRSITCLVFIYCRLWGLLNIYITWYLYTYNNDDDNIYISLSLSQTDGSSTQKALFFVVYNNNNIFWCCCFSQGFPFSFLNFICLHTTRMEFQFLELEQNLFFFFFWFFQCQWRQRTIDRTFVAAPFISFFLFSFMKSDFRRWSLAISDDNSVSILKREERESEQTTRKRKEEYPNTNKTGNERETRRSVHTPEIHALLCVCLLTVDRQQKSPLRNDLVSLSHLSSLLQWLEIYSIQLYSLLFSSICWLVCCCCAQRGKWF